MGSWTAAVIGSTIFLIAMVNEFISGMTGVNMALAVNWFSLGCDDRHRGACLARSKTDTAGELDQFLASIEKRAFKMAVIATRNRDDALDIVQDAMIKLVRNYADRTTDEWGALFHRILQSTILDWYRRTKVRNRWRVFLGGKDQQGEDEEDLLEKLAVSKLPGPEVQVQHDVVMQKLDKAVDSLPLRQQQVFLLRQWEGLDVAQTAAAMGITQGSVKTHYSRAVQSLRESLEDHW